MADSPFYYRWVSTQLEHQETANVLFCYENCKSAIFKNGKWRGPNWTIDDQILISFRIKTLLATACSILWHSQAKVSENHIWKFDCQTWKWFFRTQNRNYFLSGNTTFSRNKNVNKRNPCWILVQTYTWARPIDPRIISTAGRNDFSENFLKTLGSNSR